MRQASSRPLKAVDQEFIRCFSPEPPPLPPGPPNPHARSLIPHPQPALAHEQRPVVEARDDLDVVVKQLRRHHVLRRLYGLLPRVRGPRDHETELEPPLFDELALEENGLLYWGGSDATERERVLC